MTPIPTFPPSGSADPVIEKGIALIAPLVELVCWGAVHDAAPDADPAAIRRIQRREALARKLAERYREMQSP